MKLGEALKLHLKARKNERNDAGDVVQRHYYDVRDQKIPLIPGKKVATVVGDVTPGKMDVKWIGHADLSRQNPTDPDTPEDYEAVKNKLGTKGILHVARELRRRHGTLTGIRVSGASAKAGIKRRPASTEKIDEVARSPQRAGRLLDYIHDRQRREGSWIKPNKPLFGPHHDIPGEIATIKPSNFRELKPHRGLHEPPSYENIPVNKTIDTQGGVSREGVKKYLNKPQKQWPPIRATAVKGKFEVDDGHHRRMAARLLGSPEVRAGVKRKPKPLWKSILGIKETSVDEIDLSHVPEIAGHLSWAMYYADPANHAAGVTKHLAQRGIGKVRAAAAKGKAKLTRFKSFTGKKPTAEEIAEALDEDYKPHPGVMWHGSFSGDLRGGKTGLHLGTRAAAHQALTARIGHPATGTWDGTREYGKTLLAGQATIKARGEYVSGRNVHAPQHDYYAHEHSEGHLTHANGDKADYSHKPSIEPYRITGRMSNTIDRPHDDFKANGYMQANLKKGTAKRGFYYRNTGEDSGSIAATVPTGLHVKHVDNFGGGGPL